MKNFDEHHPSDVLEEEYDIDGSNPENLSTKQPTVPLELKQIDLHINVTDSETGHPVKFACLSLDEIGVTAVCNSDGTAVINNLLTGSYLIDVISPGYRAATLKAALIPEDLCQIHVKMIRNA